MTSFEDKREGLIVELTTQVAENGDVAMLDFGKLNLSSQPTRKTLSKNLPGILTEQEWHARLKTVCYLAVNEWRTGGEQFIDLKSVEIDYSKPAYLLPPFIPETGIVINYGNGEAMKSLTSLAEAGSVASGAPLLGVEPTRTGPVMFLDWEDGAETHKERMQALFDAADVEWPDGAMIFRRMDRSLIDSEERVQQEVAARGVVLVVYDSLGTMCGADPSDPQAIIANFNAAQRMMVPGIMIHHLSADQAYGKANKEKGYGSIYIRNSARMQWLFERPRKEGSEELEPKVYLTSTKVNRGERQRRRAYAIETESDDLGHLISARYSGIDAADYQPEVADTYTNGLRITSALKHAAEPLTVADLEERTGLTDGVLRKTLSRLEVDGRVLRVGKGDHNATLWAARIDREYEV